MLQSAVFMKGSAMPEPACTAVQAEHHESHRVSTTLSELSANPAVATDGPTDSSALTSCAPLAHLLVSGNTGVLGRHHVELVAGGGTDARRSVE